MLTASSSQGGTSTRFDLVAAPVAAAPATLTSPISVYLAKSQSGSPKKRGSRSARLAGLGMLRPSADPGGSASSVPEKLRPGCVEGLDNTIRGLIPTVTRTSNLPDPCGTDAPPPIPCTGKSGYFSFLATNGEKQNRDASTQLMPFSGASVGSVGTVGSALRRFSSSSKSTFSQLASGVGDPLGVAAGLQGKGAPSSKDRPTDDASHTTMGDTAYSDYEDGDTYVTLDEATADWSTREGRREREGPLWSRCLNATYGIADGAYDSVAELIEGTELGFFVCGSDGEDGPHEERQMARKKADTQAVADGAYDSVAELMEGTELGLLVCGADGEHGAAHGRDRQQAQDRADAQEGSGRGLL